MLVPWRIGEFDEEVTFTELCSKIYMEDFRDDDAEYTVDRISLSKSQVERMICSLLFSAKVNSVTNLFGNFVQFEVLVQTPVLDVIDDDDGDPVSEHDTDTATDHHDADASQVESCPRSVASVLMANARKLASQDYLPDLKTDSRYPNHNRL